MTTNCMMDLAQLQKAADGANDSSEIGAKSRAVGEANAPMVTPCSTAKTGRGSMNRGAVPSIDVRGTAGERRLLYQMESKSMRLKSEWRFTPETILEGEDPLKTTDDMSSNLCSSIDVDQRPSPGPLDQREIEHSARKDRSDSREAHVGSEVDEVEDRMNEIDGEIRQMPASSVLDKVKHLLHAT